MTIPRLLVPLSLAGVLLAGPGAAGGPEMPPMLDELRPMVGTWQRVHHAKKKDVTLYLVIDQDDDGRLRIRYQLPVKHKKYTSDWKGQIELDLQVNMKEKHRVAFSTVADPPRIETQATISYSGTSKSRALEVRSAYELDDEGNLLYRCLRVKEKDKDNEFTCPPAMTYERVSDETKWPD